jgi:hypothetical protein
MITVLLQMKINSKLTVSPFKSEVPVREADEVKLWESHALHKVHTAARLPLVDQMLCGVCICETHTNLIEYEEKTI